MSLHAHGLARSFSSRQGAPLHVLRDVSMELQPGESLAILGASGSGKSTLLHILGTLDRPDAGRVRLGEQDPFALDAAALADFRNTQLGFVFQDHHLLNHLTAWENVLIPTLAQGSATGEQRERAEALLTRVGLRDRQDHYPAELSGGERQRVAVARALMMRPQLILADEPTGNLDAANSTSIADLLMEARQETSEAPPMLVMVTHSTTLAARLDRRVTLEEGRLVAIT